MPTLFEKSGAEGDYRRFKFEIAKIAKENGLPGYSLELEPRSEAEPLLRMTRRPQDASKERPPLPCSLPSRRKLLLLRLRLRSNFLEQATLHTLPLVRSHAQTCLRLNATTA
jgi:hypothetical protein